MGWFPLRRRISPQQLLVCAEGETTLKIDFGRSLGAVTLRGNDRLLIGVDRPVSNRPFTLTISNEGLRIEVTSGDDSTAWLNGQAVTLQTMSTGPANVSART